MSEPSVILLHGPVPTQTLGRLDMKGWKPSGLCLVFSLWGTVEPALRGGPGSGTVFSFNVQGTPVDFRAAN